MTHAKKWIHLSGIAVFVFLILQLFITAAGASNNLNTLVKTDYGHLKGYVENDVMIWKGVPYAKPPVGELRWKAPLQPVSWRGVRDATQPAKKCTQLLTGDDWIRTGVVDPESSEDCLYVDIYRPQRPLYRHEKLPVYVWIHGGSNNFGSARQYDGTNLALRSDVVVVVVQYRLGPLGWLYHPAIQTGGADILSDSGNFGTLDHARALSWIQKNIDAFGGNPHNVLVTGESAGAHNTMNMVISPLGRGLFHKAMSQSGGMATVPAATGLAQANDIIEKLIRLKENVDAATAKARRLAMESDATLQGYLRASTAGDLFLAMLRYGSVPTFPAYEDGTVMPAGGWIPAIRSGNYNRMPIILGSNAYESKSFMPLYYAYVKQLGVPSGPYTWFQLINVLKQDLPLALNDVLPTQHDKDVYEITGYFGSQNWKAKYVDTVAHELADVQDRVYAYLFKWGGPGSGPSPFDFIYGAGHAAEIPFFFGGDKGLFGYPFVPANEAGRVELQAAMMNYLANFAWTGNPNSYFAYRPGGWGHCRHVYLPRWKTWSNTAGAPKLILFDADFNQAKIEMSSTELTIEGVTTAFEAAMTQYNLTPLEKAAARIFQFSRPW
jgi:para-nitrobenzyl esterase